MRRDPPKTSGATNASANSNTEHLTATVTNYKWGKLIVGIYPKGTSDEDRATLNASRNVLDARALAVANVLAWHWNKGEGCARPGVKRIADGAQVSKTTAQKRIDLLEDAGWLHVQRRPGRAGNRYFLLSPVRETSPSKGGHSEGAETSPSEPEMSPSESETSPPRRGTELTELEKELDVAVHEEPDLSKFLDAIADKLDTGHRHKLDAERRAVGNRPTLKAIHARIGDRPGQRARDVANASDLNNAERSVLGYILKVMEEVPAPTTPSRDDGPDCPQCHGTGWVAGAGAGSDATRCACQTEGART